MYPADTGWWLVLAQLYSNKNRPRRFHLGRGGGPGAGAVITVETHQKARTQARAALRANNSIYCSFLAASSPVASLLLVLEKLRAGVHAKRDWIPCDRP